MTAAADLPSLEIPAIAELATADQWVIYRLPNKVPLQTSGHLAKSNDPDTWASFEECAGAFVRDVGDGLGFVFSADDDLIGIDFDHCLDAEGNITDPWVAETVDKLASYTEVSPSGDGLHVYVKGTIQKSIKTQAIEVYTRGRYFTVSGQHYAGTPQTIEWRQGVLDALSARLGEQRRAERQEAESRDKVAPGGRHEAVLVRTRRAYLMGLRGAELEAVALAFNAERCDPPKPDEEVRSIVGWIETNVDFDPGPEPAWATGEDGAEQLLPDPRIAARATILSAADFADDEVPPEIVEGLVHEDALISQTGASKAGKSIVANQMAMAIATGTDFLGLRVRQCPVLLASLEMSAALVRDRMERISRDVRIPMPEVGRDLFIIAPTRRRTAALDLTSIEGRDHLTRCVETIGARVVVLDTLYKFCLGADPNDNATMGQLFSDLADLAQTTGAALVVLDHVAKGAGSGVVSQSALGAQIKGGAARTIAHLKRVSAADGGAWELNVESHFGNWDEPIAYKRPKFDDGGWGFGCVRCSGAEARGVSGDALRAVFMKHGTRDGDDGSVSFASQGRLIEALRAEGLVEGDSREAGQRIIRSIEPHFIADHQADDKIRRRYPVWREEGGHGKATSYRWIESVWEWLNQ